MTDRTKFEKMLELLINEDREAAEELFHEIVVEKSRDIYEGLLESELEDEDIEEASEDEDEVVDEADDEEVDESDEELDEFEIEEGDPSDDMIGDIEMDGGDDEEADMDMDMDGEEGEEAGDDELEDRIEDLEDALDELSKEFEAMLAGESGEEEHSDMDMGGEEAGEDDMEEESFEFESAEVEGEKLDEYTQKVAEPKGEDNKATSPVAGKNDMGGTAANIAKGSAEEKGGKAETPKVDDAGNVNTSGNKKAPGYSKA